MKPSEDQINSLNIFINIIMTLYKTLWHYFNDKHIVLTNSHVKKKKCNSAYGFIFFMRNV